MQETGARRRAREKDGAEAADRRRRPPQGEADEVRRKVREHGAPAAAAQAQVPRPPRPSEVRGKPQRARSLQHLHSGGAGHGRAGDRLSDDKRDAGSPGRRDRERALAAKRSEDIGVGRNCCTVRGQTLQRVSNEACETRGKS